MKLPRYPNEQDVGMRLGHSYIRYKGFAAYVVNTTGFLVQLIQDPHTKKLLNVHSDDPLLDISSPPTGYCWEDDEPRTYWVARLPLRQQKQGLEGHSIRGHIEHGDFATESLHGLPSLKATLAMIDGKFLPLAECLDLIGRKRTKAAPFDRNFCLTSLKDSKFTLGIKFMGGPIGLLDSRTNTAILSHKYRESPVAAVLAEKFQIEVQDAETTE